jgi:hypothetical protein
MVEQGSFQRSCNAILHDEIRAREGDSPFIALSYTVLVISHPVSLWLDILLSFNDNLMFVVTICNDDGGKCRGKARFEFLGGFDPSSFSGTLSF